MTSQDRKRPWAQQHEHERIKVATSAPGNGAPLAGVKVVAKNGWFAARPSGTENIYKIYAESFLGVDHLRLIQDEAQMIVNDALAALQ